MNESVKSYRVLAARKSMTTEAWLKLRLGYLKISEISTAIGLNPYQTPNSLWAIKTGIIKPEYKDNDAMFWGRTLEPVLRNHYQNTENCIVKEVPYILQSTEHPWICGNIDGVAIYNEIARAKGQPEKAIIEIKTGNSFTESEWGDDACPIQFFIETMMYCWLCRISRSYLIALIGGSKYHIVPIDYDEATVEVILKQAEIFWQHVKTRTPLPATYGDNALISKIFPTGKPTSVALSSEFIPKVNRLCAIKEQLAELKKQEDKLEAELKQAIGINEMATIGNYRISWKPAARSTFSAEKAKELLTEEQISACTITTSTRTLRISQAKTIKK